MSVGGKLRTTGHFDLSHPTSVADLEEADKSPFGTGTQYPALLNKSSLSLQPDSRAAKT
jgi:hypothetical protein